MRSERSRAIGFRLLALLMVIVAAEGAGRIAYRVAFGHAYTRGGIVELSADATYLPRASQNLTYLNNQVLHPYFGFAFAGSPKAAERHGFVTGYPPRDPAPPGTLSVLVTGGSVALQLSPWIQHTLRERLKGRATGPRGVRLFAAALGGFKQPQQLMALNYLLAMGASFDLVVNIDGYNDVVLPYAENAQIGVNPAYPRRFDYRFRTIGNVEELTRLGEMAFLNRRKEALARFHRESPWTRSVVVGFPVAVLFQRADRRIAELTELTMDADAATELPFEAAGPPFAPRDARSVIGASVDLWARSSRLMADLARARGIPYLHVLQPNQHDAGAKPLTEEERTKYYREGSLQEEAVRIGYPLLVERSRELAASGVDFLDATRVFEHEARTLYKDPCCHLNRLGLELLSRVVTDALVERLPNH